MKASRNEQRAEELLKTTEKLAEETGVPCMADVVANTGEDLTTYIDFVTSVSDMPFCWVGRLTRETC